MMEEEVLDEIDEELPALVDPETREDDLLEDEFEMVTLSFRQKLWIGAVTLVSFLFFAVYFLPFDLILRYGLAQVAGSVRVDFIKFDPGLFGPDRIEELKVQVPNGTSLQAETVESTLSYRDLLSNRARGTVNLEQLDVSMASFAGKIPALNVALNMRGFEGGLARMQGSIALKTEGIINITKLSLPDALPIAIDPSSVKIKEINLRLRANRGNINLDGSSLQSNLMSLTLRGGGRTSGGLDRLNLSLRACIKPDSRLESTNPDIFGYFVMMGGSGAAGGEKCFELTGNPGSPQFKPVQ